MPLPSHKLPAQNCHRLPTQIHAISVHTKAHHATTHRGLIGNKLILAEPLAPEGSETAVGRAGDRVFVDAYLRREKAGDKIIAWRGGTTGDYHTTNGYCGQ